MEYGGWGRGGHKKGENWREPVKLVIPSSSGVGRLFEGGGTRINEKNRREVVFNKDDA